LLLCYRIGAFPHWQIVSYSSLSATFLAGAVVLVLGAHALGAGACVGAAVLCKQDYGLGVGAALGLAILLAPERTGKVRRALAFAGSVAFVVAPALLSFAAHGALRPFFDQTVVRPLRAAATSRYLGLPPLLPLLHQDAALRAGIGSYFPAVLLTLAERWSAIHSGWLYRETAVWDVVLKLLFYAPFLVWAAAALRWARGGLRDRHLVLLAYAGGFLLAFNRPRDWVHLMMVYPPVLLVGTTLLAAAPGRAARVLPSAALGLLALLSAELGRELRHAFDWPLASPRAGVLADAHNGPLLDELLAYIDAHAPPGPPAVRVSRAPLRDRARVCARAVRAALVRARPPAAGAAARHGASRERRAGAGALVVHARAGRARRHAGRAGGGARSPRRAGGAA